VVINQKKVREISFLSRYIYKILVQNDKKSKTIIHLLISRGDGKKKKKACVKFYINGDCSALSTTSSSSLSELDDSVSDTTPRCRGTLEEMWMLIGEDAGGMGSARSMTAWTLFETPRLTL
jgi:hypothetical protein